MAIKIVETCTYVLPSVLGSTTLGVLYKYGKVYVTCFLFFSTGMLFLVRCIGRTFVMYKEMFVFQFFPYWLVLRNCLDQQLLRLRDSH